MSGGDYDPLYDDVPGRPARRPDPAAARGKLVGPAVGLALIAALGLFFTLLGVVNNKPAADQMAEFDKGLDANPNTPEADKKMIRDFVRPMFETQEQLFPVLIAAGVIGNLLIALGAYNLLNPGSRGLALTGCVLSLIPGASGCCCLGLVFGIWGLVALSDPAVKALYAAADAPPDPDFDPR